jgi:hypothetical protein
MNDDPTPTLRSIGRCFVGALHGPSDKANDKVSVVNWNFGMAPSSKYCSAQRYAPATDSRATQVLRTGTESALGHKRTLPRVDFMSALPSKADIAPRIMSTTAAIGSPYRRYGSPYVIEKSRGEAPKSGHWNCHFYEGCATATDL